MEYKKLKPTFETKRGFALLFTILVVAVLFLYSYSIVQSNVFSSNLNKLKYMNLQAQIHFEYIKNYIDKHSNEQIKQLSLDDNRFNLTITSKTDQNTTTYYVVIEAKPLLSGNDELPIRLSKKIIK